ncbi:MAG: TolC family outer membrane protein [Hyphomicrobiales bacterium]
MAALAALLVAPVGLSAAEKTTNATINAALESAYRSNPTLNAERARQRATDENVPQALSGWRPTVSAGGQYGASWNAQKGIPRIGQNPANVVVSLTQPVFTGFKTTSGTAQAEALVRAGRQTLLATEQDVLLDGATAYMNVIRDRSVLQLRQKNVQVLTEELRASQARFDVGEITRTDVSQAQARLELSKSALSQAQAQLAASMAFYTRVVGSEPGRLIFPPLPPAMPPSLDAALAEAESINPNILAAAFSEEAARYNIDLVRSNLYPQVSVSAQYSYQQDTSPLVAWSDSAQIFGQVQIPIYEGGYVYSQVRQAKQVASQRRIEILGARRAVREQVTSSWNNFQAATAVIVSQKASVEANRLALEGVRQEALVGSRTTLDVLDAEQEYIDSQVILVTAQRDRIIAAYQLLAAIGRMTAQSLRLGVVPYNAEDNYLNVRDKFIGADAKTVD